MRKKNDCDFVLKSQINDRNAKVTQNQSFSSRKKTPQKWPGICQERRMAFFRQGMRERERRKKEKVTLHTRGIESKVT